MSVEQFLHTFFQHQACNITKLEDGVIEVNLTEAMDQALMNRPFYWHYVKATGQKGVPAKLRLTTNNKKRKKNEEWIHFGTPRMNVMSQYLEQTSRFIQTFEQLKVEQQTALHPWLIINVLITFKGKQVKEHLLSIGLNLITGSLINEAMEQIQDKQFDQTISPHCYTLSPLIKLPSGFRRVEQQIEGYLKRQNYAWVLDTIILLKEELLMLKYFYDRHEKKKALKNEVRQLYERLKPEVSYEVINGGLFYLATK